MSRTLDDNFTKKIQAYLAILEPTEDDLQHAAELLHRATRDHGLWLRCVANPQRMHSFMDHKLKRILAMRLDGLTIGMANRLDNEVTPQVKAAIERESHGEPPSRTPDNPRSTGRRPDHDLLPDEIRKLWDDNAARWLKIKRYYNTLLTLAQPCDRYEVVKPLHQLWREYRQGMSDYDDYSIEQGRICRPASKGRPLRNTRNKPET